MKITQTDYEYLQTSILNVLAKYTEEQILKHRKTVKFVTNQFNSFVWSIMHHIPVDSNMMTRLYGQGYNDSHIETALKRILKKYK